MTFYFDYSYLDDGSTYTLSPLPLPTDFRTLDAGALCSDSSSITSITLFDSLGANNSIPCVSFGSSGSGTFPIFPAPMYIVIQSSGATGINQTAHIAIEGYSLSSNPFQSNSFIAQPATNTAPIIAYDPFFDITLGIVLFMLICASIATLIYKFR